MWRYAAARPAQTAPKRTPAKEGKAAAPVSSSKPKGEKDSEGGKSRRKNSEGSKEGKGKGEGDAKEGNSRRKPSGDASATPSKTVSNKPSKQCTTLIFVCM